MYKANRVLIHDEELRRNLEFIFDSSGRLEVVLSSLDGKLWSIAELAYVDKELIFQANLQYNKQNLEAKPKSPI